MTEREKLVERARAVIALHTGCDDEDVARALIAAIYEALKEPSVDMLYAAHDEGAWVEDMPLEKLSTLFRAMLAASPLNSNKTGDE